MNYRPGEQFIGRCVDCGREARLSFTPYDLSQVRCNDCHRRMRGGAQRATSANQLAANYLRLGYYDKQGHLRPEIYVEDAQQVVEAFGRNKMSSSQLRRPFGKVKFIQQKLGAEESFDAIRSEIVSLRRDAAYQAGRDPKLEVMKQFIDRNVDLAVENEKNFAGFVEHFESVVAWYKYAASKEGRHEP